VDPGEPLGLQQLLGDEPVDQREEPDREADQVLLECQGDRAHSCTSVLHQECLDNQGAHDDTQEQAVVEETLEYVVFLVT
jgi:hypothetical protein